MRITKHYVDEIGLNIIVDCGVDVSNISVAKLEVRRPDATTVEWTAVPYYYNGTPNYLLYTTVDNDLLQAGVYKVQAYIKRVSGTGDITWETLGETASFPIYNRFE